MSDDDGDTIIPFRKRRGKLSAALEFITYNQFIAAQTDDPYLIKELLAPGSMAVIYGAPGSGKTFLALHLALCCAADRVFFGRRVRQCGVVYIAAEAGRGIQKRLAAYQRATPIEDPASLPFAAVTSPVDLCDPDGDVQQLIAAINNTKQPAGLIVIDTLSRTMNGGNENQPDDMGAFVQNIDKLRKATGACVLIVHHSGKDTARGARGHNLLVAAVDTEIEVIQDKATKISTASVTKQREFSTEGVFVFSLKQIELGVDQDGDPIASCVVNEDGPTDTTPKVKRPPLPPSRQVAMRMLAEAINHAGELPPSCNHIPPDKRCVREALWREYAYRGGISTGDAEARKKTFRRSADDLVAKQLVGAWDEWRWPA